jgi:hypothetical protein
MSLEGGNPFPEFEKLALNVSAVAEGNLGKPEVMTTGHKVSIYIPGL